MQRQLDTIEREVGVRVSESIAKGIKESGKATQFFTGDIFREALSMGTATVDDLAREVGDIFAVLAQGGLSKPEAIVALENSVPLILENLKELGPAGEAEIARIIDAAKVAGVEFTGLSELIQSTFAPATVESMSEAFGKTNAEIRSIASTLGINVQTELQRVAASVGLTGQQFKALGAALETQFGIPAEQLAEFLESTGVTAADLAEKLGVDVGAGAMVAADAQAQANERMSEGVNFAAQMADHLERAARASGGISFGGGGSLPVTGAARGLDAIATRPNLLMVGEGNRPERVTVTPLSGGDRGGGGNISVTVPVTVMAGAVTTNEGELAGAISDAVRVVVRDDLGGAMGEILKKIPAG
jgi:hypothetical protein